MTITNEMIKAVLSIAKTLQTSYDIMGIPATQNVRNPYPMNKLIIAILPRNKKGLTVLEMEQKLNQYGYRIKASSLKSIVSDLKMKGLIKTVRFAATNRRGRKAEYYSLAF